MHRKGSPTSRPDAQNAVLNGKRKAADAAVPDRAKCTPLCAHPVAVKPRYRLSLVGTNPFIVRTVSRPSERITAGNSHFFCTPCGVRPHGVIFLPTIWWQTCMLFGQVAPSACHERTKFTIGTIDPSAPRGSRIRKCYRKSVPIVNAAGVVSLPGLSLMSFIMSWNQRILTGFSPHYL
jgi:hypothetical protein